MLSRCTHHITPAEACWDCANPYASRRPDPGVPFSHGRPDTRGGWRAADTVLHALDRWDADPWAVDIIRRAPGARDPGSGRQRDDFIDLILEGLRR